MTERMLEEKVVSLSPRRVVNPVNVRRVETGEDAGGEG